MIPIEVPFFDHIYPKYMLNPMGLKGKEIVVFSDASMRYNPFLTYYRYDYLALTFEVLSLLEINNDEYR